MADNVSNILFSFIDGASGGVSECVDTRDISNCFLPTWLLGDAVGTCDLCLPLTLSVTTDAAIDDGTSVDANSADGVIWSNPSLLCALEIPLLVLANANGVLLSIWFKIVLLCGPDFVKYLLPDNCNDNDVCVVESEILGTAGTGDDMDSTTEMIVSPISTAAWKWREKKQCEREMKCECVC